MNQRVDELTLKLVDEPGSSAERTELARALERTPAVRLKHITLLEVEATLRGGGRSPSIAPAVMEAIQRGSRLSRAHRAGLRDVPAQDPKEHLRRRFFTRVLRMSSRWRLWLLFLLLVGSATAAAVLGGGQHRRPSERHAGRGPQIAASLAPAQLAP